MNLIFDINYNLEIIPGSFGVIAQHIVDIGRKYRKRERERCCDVI